MSEQNANPLNMSLNDMDTSIPLLDKGDYDLRITKVELTKTAGKNGATPVAMLKGEAVNVDPGLTPKGDVIPAGQGKLFFNVVLAPTGKLDWGMVGRGVAEIVQSTKLDLSPYGSTGIDQINAAATWHKQLEGRVGRAKVAYVPEGPDKGGVVRRAKNEITYWSKS
jgi:hypothetical protein